MVTSQKRNLIKHLSQNEKNGNRYHSNHIFFFELVISSFWKKLRERLRSFYFQKETDKKQTIEG